MLYDIAMQKWVDLGSFEALPWEFKRIVNKRSFGDCCFRCGTFLTDSNFHCHHLTYVRKGNECITDMVPICSGEYEDGFGCHLSSENNILP